MITRSSARLATGKAEVSAIDVENSEASSSSIDDDGDYHEIGSSSSDVEQTSSVSDIEYDAREEDIEVISSPESLTLDKGEQDIYAEAVRLINGGDLKKMKVEHCKAYLRKYGLRLTGSKLVLLERIQEHLEIKDGGGKVKYPVSTFTINCTGDACTGDVVLFKQKVYEKFDLVSRSSSLPPLGKRVVAGRIVKESYGAAKQQHTFTVEVLWSTGVRALPPLYPLIIKGRNLYRLRTLRKPWLDESDRKKILCEKHARGATARHIRVARNEAKKFYKLNGSQKLSSQTLLLNASLKDSMERACMKQPSSRGIPNARKPAGSISTSSFNSGTHVKNSKISNGAVTLLKMSIKASVAGIVIGKHGTNVRQITGATGAKLHVREDKFDPRMRVVEISGTSGQTELARKMILQNLKSRGFSFFQ